VSGKVKISPDGGDAQHGIAIHFAFDSRDDSWQVSASYHLVSPTLNVSVAVGASSECRPSGIHIKGDVSVAIGGGVLKGFANGAFHCGEYRKAKGAIAIEAGVSEANLAFPGVQIFIRNATVALRGFPPPSALQYPWEEPITSYAAPAKLGTTGTGGVSSLGAVTHSKLSSGWKSRWEAEQYGGVMTGAAGAPQVQLLNTMQMLQRGFDEPLFACPGDTLLRSFEMEFGQGASGTKCGSFFGSKRVCHPGMRTKYTCSAQDANPVVAQFGECKPRYTELSDMFTAFKDAEGDKGWQAMHGHEWICDSGYALRNVTLVGPRGCALRCGLMESLPGGASEPRAGL
jgi:hypothetical protein